MKSKFLFGALMAFMLITAAAAWKGNESADYLAPPSKFQVMPAVTDTITNSEDDTLTLSSTDIQSRYTYVYHVVRTNISGTTNVGVLLQESTTQSGTIDWATIDSTAAATATVGRITGDEVYGRRHRLILQGRGATQSSKYVVTRIMKLKN